VLLSVNGLSRFFGSHHGGRRGEIAVQLRSSNTRLGGDLAEGAALVLQQPGELDLVGE
jgi:hypothetical protein